MHLALLIALLPCVQQPQQSWSFSAMGKFIGKSDIVTADVNGQPEIFCGGSQDGSGGNNFWYSLRRDPLTGSWTQTHVSSYFEESFTDNLARLDMGRVLPGHGESLVVLRGDGVVEFFDPVTKAMLGTFDTAAYYAKSMDLADLDGDGLEEIIVVYGSWTRIFDSQGNLLGAANYGGVDVVVAQMDNDLQLEIAVTDGEVLDGASLTPQWTWPGGFGLELAAEDIDGDGRAELVAMENWNYIWAFNVDLQLPLWTISVSDPESVRLVDMEDDGNWELLVGDQQFGDVNCYDALSTAHLWTLPTPVEGVSDMLALDVDADGDKEIIWGAGSSSSYHVYVADWQTGIVQWRSEYLHGPFIGPALGDLDGDNHPELVVVGGMWDGRFLDDRIFVFDALSLDLSAVSPPIASGRSNYGSADVRLFDVDRNGSDEVVLATDRDGGGMIEIYSYSAGTFSLLWTNPLPRPAWSPCRSVAIGDVDLDGDLEVVAGIERANFSGDHHLFYVYDHATISEEWRSPEIGSNGDSVSRLEIADVDQDGIPEILGMVMEGEVYVYDGATKALESFILGSFTALQTLKVGSKTYLLLGDVDGRVHAYLWNGAVLSEVYRRRLALDPVDGINPGPFGAAWIGAAGQLSLLLPKSGAVLWQSANYGATFGTRVVQLPGPLVRFISSGLFSVTGFR